MGEMTAFEGAMLAHFPLFLAVDSYGAWGREALVFLAQVTARLAIHKSLPKSQASFDLFSKHKHLFNKSKCQSHPPSSIELNLCL